MSEDAAPKKSLVKREPVAIASAFLTLVGTVLFVAPSVGLAIPDNVAKIVQLVFTLAGGLGVRMLVKPV